jgi:hypothetical protein
MHDDYGADLPILITALNLRTRKHWVDTVLAPNGSIQAGHGAKIAPLPHPKRQRRPPDCRVSP